MKVSTGDIRCVYCTRIIPSGRLMVPLPVRSRDELESGGEVVEIGGYCGSLSCCKSAIYEYPSHRRGTCEQIMYDVWCRWMDQDLDEALQAEPSIHRSNYTDYGGVVDAPEVCVGGKDASGNHLWVYDKMCYSGSVVTCLSDEHVSQIVKSSAFKTPASSGLVLTSCQNHSEAKEAATKRAAGVETATLESLIDELTVKAEHNNSKKETGLAKWLK